VESVGEDRFRTEPLWCQLRPMGGEDERTTAIVVRTHRITQLLVIGERPSAKRPWLANGGEDGGVEQVVQPRISRHVDLSFSDLSSHRRSSTHPHVKIRPHRRSGNNPPASSSTVCQNCLGTGQWTGNCKLFSRGS
jgi:hypothetical protein